MTFDEWLNESEGFGLRCERLMEDLIGAISINADKHNPYPYNIKMSVVVLWLKAAYEAGYKEGKEDAFDDLDNYGSGLDL